MKDCSCSVGIALNESCNDRPFMRRSKLAPRDAHLLDRRTNCNVKLVCPSHFNKYITKFQRSQKSCSDPLGLHPQATVRTSLKPVSATLHDRCVHSIPTVIQDKQLCITCRTEVYKRLELSQSKPGDGAATLHAIPARMGRSSLAACPSPAAPGFVVTEQESLPYASSDSGNSEVSSGSVCSPRVAVLDRINKGLSLLGTSPIVDKQLARSTKYREGKCLKVSSLLKQTLAKAAGKSVQGVCDTTDYEKAGREMLSQLKEAFRQAKNYSEKVTVLSVLPASWSIAKINAEFGATYHMVRFTKGLVEKDGILCSPNARRGKTLPAETEKLIVDFYELPDISREMAGKKECISVKEDGARTIKQKRLVLGDLKEIFETFKDRNPDVTVGFSKFASLRPRHCVLAGAAGTHAVCVCMIHQNFKLMFMGANIGSLWLGDDKPFEHYKDCVSMTICTNPSEDCYFGKCEKCPGTDAVEEKLRNIFQSNMVSHVNYKAWMKRDNERYSLETVQQGIDNFIDSFIAAIPELRQHDYIARQQAAHFENVKNSLRPGEILVVGDFSQNFCFVIQDSIQGVYWNNNQATIHPFACYRRNPDSMNIEPFNLVIISDHLKHNTATVSKFQEVLVASLKAEGSQVHKIYYFSDGCTGQYKNRFNMKNLVMHQEEYGIRAEWHFFATSHGKGPSDGLGGTLKRNATKASLQRPYTDQIQSPMCLYNWAVKSLKNIKCAFVTTEEVQLHTKKLAKRFATAPSLEGIRSHHAFLPLSADVIEMKVLSSSASGRVIRLREATVDPEDDEGLDPDDLNQPIGPMTRKRTAQRPILQSNQVPKTPRQLPSWRRSGLKRARTAQREESPGPPQLNLLQGQHGALPARSPWRKSRLRQR